MKNIALGIIAFLAYVALKFGIVFMCAVIYMLILASGIDLMAFISDSKLWEIMHYIMIILLSCAVTAPAVLLLCNKYFRKYNKKLIVMVDVAISIANLVIVYFMIRP